MKKKQLEKRLAYLQSIHDHLLTELEYIDFITRAIGFPEGTNSLKETAKKMLDNSIALND